MCEICEDQWSFVPKAFHFCTNLNILGNEHYIWGVTDTTGFDNVIEEFKHWKTFFKAVSTNFTVLTVSSLQAGVMMGCLCPL